jgi:hypothetical protein
MSEVKPKRLSPLKWALGLLALVCVMVVCGGLPFLLKGPPPNAAPPTTLGAAIIAMLGVIVAALGAALYGLVLLSGCFTFNFRKPFFRGFKGRLWLANLITGLLIQTGFALVTAPFLHGFLVDLLPPQIAVAVAFFGPFVVMQLIFIWLTIWAPLEKFVINRRMRALGISPEHIAAGWHVGISNPDKSSFRKLSLVEEDIGMLWLEASRIVYFGDSQSWEIPHANLLDIERKADAGSTSSYFGAVHVILKFLDLAGAERRIRLHPEGGWTMTAKAKLLNVIAERLNAWKENPTAGWVFGRTGFDVVSMD